jgi:subtilisin family serine protease
MRRITAFLALLCALAAPLLTHAPTRVQASTGTSQKPVEVFIALKGPALAADGNLKRRSAFTKWRYRLDPTLAAARGYMSQLTRYQNDEIAYIRSQGIKIRVNRHFNVLNNGFSAFMTRSDLQRVQSLPNVAAALVEPRVNLLLDKSIGLVHAPEAWTELGGQANAGKGMMIADIDSGIDITNQCFSGASMPAPPRPFPLADTSANAKLTNNKVIVARAFGGDASQQFSAADAVGHGTFTAAIEACDAGTATPLGTKVSGVAPAAWLMNYNVFPGDGCGSAASSCTSAVEDPVLQGLQAALLDGADVINMSLGSSLSSGDLSLDPFAQAVNLATVAGIPAIVSAGNAGPTLQSVSSPAVASGAIAVGATTNSRVVVTSEVSVSSPAPVPSALQKMRASQGTHAWTGPIGPYGMVYVGLGRLPKDDTTNPTADDFAGKDLKGKIAVIRRGTIFFETKINNAMKQGAVGAIILDNIDELSFSGDMKSATLPTAFLLKSDGDALLSFLQQHPDAAVTLNSDINSYAETPNALADFSSRGFGPDYSIKPDMVAPGQNIYSATEKTIPNSDLYNPSGFVSADGTSFSAPHVTGAAALLLQEHPKWTPAIVKDVLVQTTDRVVLTSATNTSEPPVTEQGSGLLDVQRALAATAYVSPASLSFGQVNTALNTTPLSSTLTLNDVGGATGTWTVTSQALEGGSGAALTLPSTVQLPANGHVSIPVSIQASPAAPAGNFDGFITLSHGSQVLHLSYFLHAVDQPIKKGSVLLLDATQSRFQSQPPSTPVQHLSVDSYYRNALTAIGQSYTYWDDSKLGPPSVNDLKQASAVVVFTGANLNGFAAQNDNYEALLGPLGSLDVTAIRQYMDGGGNVFLSGLGVVVSDPYWAIYILGAAYRELSAYDNTTNDKLNKGGIAPPQPSAKTPTFKEGLRNPYIFGGIKPIDFSNKGDGAHDNAGLYSQGVASSGDFADGFVGVTGVTPISGCDSLRCAYGQAALQVPDLALGGPDVGVVSSDEPTFSHATKYKGRAVLFTFDFAGINDNTGYATRAQVLKRIFQWFGDTPTVKVVTSTAVAHQRTQLRVGLKSKAGGVAAQFQWKIGSKTLAASSKPVTYTFPKPGSYKVRVLVTDKLGHKTLSAVKTVTVH